MVTVTIALVCRIQNGEKAETLVTASHQTYLEALKKAKKLAEEVTETMIVLDQYVKSVTHT